MTSRTSRILVQSLKKRFYGTTAVDASESASAPLVKQGPRVTKLPNGLTVASIENYSPISHVAVIVNAGSRMESADDIGVSHALRAAAVLSTADSSSLNLVRSVQQTGGNIGCTTTREYMIYSSESLRSQAPIGVEALRQISTAPAFKEHEMASLLAKLKFDVASVMEQPGIKLLEMLHEAAYRNTLGRSLYAPEHLISSYSSEQLMGFLQRFYTQGKMALVGTGVDHEELVAQGRNFIPFDETDFNMEKAVYHGGEQRLSTNDNMTHAAVVTEGPSLTSKDLLAVGVLQMIVGTGPYVKYSENIVGSKLVQGVNAAVSNPFAVSCINANYTDNGLFGFYLVGHPEDMEKGLRAAFSTFAKITKNGVTDQEVARGKNQLKAAISMNFENGSNQLLHLAEQAIGSDKIASYNDLATAVDAIKTTDVTAVAKKVINGKASMASLGDLSHVPYLDELTK